MYQTLIVDDEPLMRQYLGHNLSNICSDFEVTGIACDGLEAVELLQKQNFDLVITDIKMPEMDGLNLAKHIFESISGTKVIIISGYNEFEYARLAIKYGVSDYLLKPLSDDCIYETLVKIKGELDQIVKQKNAMISVNDYEKCTDKEIKSALLQAVITGDTAVIQPLYLILQKRKLSFIKAYSSIMLLCPDELHLMLQEKKILDHTTYKFELHQQCQTFCNQNNYAVTCDKNGYTLLLLTADSEEDISVMANSIYQEITNSYWSRKQLKIISSYGYIVKDMLSLITSYSLAIEALTLTLKNTPSPITSNYYASQLKFINEVNTICNALYTDYVSKNLNKTQSDLSLYISLFDMDFSIAAVLSYGSYLIRYLSKKCNIKSDLMLAAFEELMKGIDQKLPTNDFDKEIIHSLYLRILKILDHEEKLVLIPETIKIVESAKEYICTHYHEQISLAMVADNLKVNPSYLSDLFHKNIGEPYTKFLTRVRMEQSLLLLKSNPNEKIYKIAEKTGFISPKHFNNVFKKYYGFTPTEYISKYLQ